MKKVKLQVLIMSGISLLIPFSVVNCQSFNFQLLSDTVEYEVPGGLDIHLEGNIINTGSIDLEIDIIRAENNLPLNWQSYMCTDVCQSTATDSTRLYLPAGQTQLFTFSFIISTLPDTGNGLIRFKNVTDVSNNFTQRLYGIATPFAGVNTVNLLDADIQLYPNPVVDKLIIKTGKMISALALYTMEGKSILSINNINSFLYTIDMSCFPTGIYFVKVFDQNGKMTSKKLIK